MGAGILLILIGVFSLVAAVAEWEWFFNSRRARFFVGIFGRDGARIFYIIFGIVLVILGIFALGDS